MSTMIIKNEMRNRIHAQKFALYISFASISMMFIAFTSAYIVKQAAGNWLEFAVPNMFYISTIVILLSSITLHRSYKAFLSGKEGMYKTLLVVSFILGITFLVLQYFGWQDMFAVGVDLKGNVSGSFVYLITGVHALHIVGGIAALIVAMVHAFTLRFRVTEKRKLRFELTLHYWHFVDLLWVYLFGFILLYR